MASQSIEKDDLINAEGLGFESEEVKECYAAFKGSDQIAKSLKDLGEEVKKLPGSKEALALVNTIKFDFGRMLARTARKLKADGKNSALLILKKHWKLYERNLSSEQIWMLNKILGISQQDIAVLLGVTQVAIAGRLERYQNSLLPADIDPDSVPEDEKAEIVMERLYKVATSNKIDRESINAARVFLELYNKKVERSAVEKWKQIEILAEFFFSRLIPSLHQEMIKAGIRLDIRSICLPLFEEASQDLRTVVNKVKLPDPDPKKKGRPRKNDAK